jgi:hypothetical protein
MDAPGSRRGLYGQRPSKCADEARLAEMERIRAMSPYERAARALELGQRAREMREALREAESRRRG